MTVDWSALGAMLSGVGTIVGAGTVVFAALIGRNTFEQWRKQKREERRMAAAEQLLVIAYKLKRAFEAIRSAGMFGAESADMDAILRQNGLLTDETNSGAATLLRTAQATLSRTTRHNPDFEEAQSMTPVAKALFGDEVEKALKVFWMQRAKVTVAAQGYADVALQREPRTEKGLDKLLERRRKYEAVIWEGGGEDGIDHIAVAIDDAIATLEAKLLPIIRHE